MRVADVIPVGRTCAAGSLTAVSVPGRGVCVPGWKVGRDFLLRPLSRGVLAYFIHSLILFPSPYALHPTASPAYVRGELFLGLLNQAVTVRVSHDDERSPRLYRRWGVWIVFEILFISVFPSFFENSLFSALIG